MVEDNFKVDRFAGQAMAQAMYPYAIGIVSDSQGMEGKGLGTGVGVVWRGTYLIVTAKHVVEDTAPDRIYYLLPQDTLRVEPSSASVDWTQVNSQPRRPLENPRILFGDRDVAAIVLPQQREPAARNHFYRIVEGLDTPAIGTNVGYLGYPAASAQPLGKNFVAMPSYAFGEICLPNCDYDQREEFALSYEPGDELDPHGFSGSGIWCSRAAGKIWSPQISLAGLATSYYRRSKVLICCRIEILTGFLAANLRSDGASP